MASKRRLRRKAANECAVKKHFPTEHEAQNAAWGKRRQSSSHRSIHHYPCPQGDGWLIGHQAGRDDRWRPHGRLTR